MFSFSEEEVLARFHQWADENSSVRAAILTGSRVNPQPCVDIFSDFDIEIYVKDLSPYWHSDDWLNAFGSILVRCPWKPGSFKDGWLTRMAVFKEGFRIDFQMTDGELAADHYIDGYRVLLDKDDMTGGLKAPTFEGYKIKKPSQEEYGKLVNEFWWDSIYIAKSLARDEIFYAKFTFDSNMRFAYFQKLIEWVIGIEHGWSTQPNKYGRFFKKYIAADRWARIEATFAGADSQHNWTAFFNALELFRELAGEVSEYFGYPYPQTLDEEVTEYLKVIKKVKYP